TAIGPRYGPMILFAAATGLRPAEWIALEKRDVDRNERVVYVRRSFTRGELKFPKTEASMRAVPLQARAIEALDQITAAGRVDRLGVRPPLVGLCVGRHQAEPVGATGPVSVLHRRDVGRAKELPGEETAVEVGDLLGGGADAAGAPP